MTNLNKIITPDKIKPYIRIANYHTVTKHATWGPRIIPDMQLIYVVSGRYTYQEPTKEQVEFSTGEILFIYPQITHTIKRIDNHNEDGAISSIHFELENGNWSHYDYQFTPTPPIVTSVPNDNEIHTLFKKCAALHQGASLYRNNILKTVFQELWLRLAEYWQSSQTSRLSNRLVKMLEFIQDNYKQKIGRKDLAQHFNLTPEHINMIFKKELGETPTQYLHRIRVNQAYQLLSLGNLSVKETAEKVGFGDEFYFSKIFKRIQGYPPSELK